MEWIRVPLSPVQLNCKWWTGDKEFKFLGEFFIPTQEKINKLDEKEIKKTETSEAE